MKIYPLKSEAPARVKVAGEAWIGIDAHKETLAFTIVDTASAIVERGNIPNARAEIVKLLGRYTGVKLTAVYEAGPTGFLLLRWLQEAGVDAFMTPPSLVPVASGDRVKTDKRDSLKLALLCRANQLKRVYARTDQDYADRSLLRCRDQAVSERSGIIRELKSLVLFHGIDVDAGRGLTKAVMTKLEELAKQAPASLAAALRIHLLRYTNAHLAVLECDRQCRHLAERIPYTRQRELLLSIPGIAEHSADRLCTELGDIKERFANPEQLCSYLGLTPSEYSTGGKEQRGHITRQGNRQARSTLVEAAWMLIRTDTAAKERYEKLKHRRGAKIAIVAIARRMAQSIFAMLRDDKEYNLPVEDKAA